jgi:hypothetical protein
MQLASPSLAPLLPRGFPPASLHFCLGASPASLHFCHGASPQPRSTFATGLSPASLHFFHGAPPHLAPLLPRGCPHLAPLLPRGCPHLATLLPRGSPPRYTFATGPSPPRSPPRYTFAAGPSPPRYTFATGLPTSLHFCQIMTSGQTFAFVALLKLFLVFLLAPENRMGTLSIVCTKVQILR